MLATAYRRCVHVFRILGDPVRFRIVETLANGPHSAGILADAVGKEFGISRSAVSHQLRILIDAGFVSVRVEENLRIYRLAWDLLDELDRVILGLYERWDRRYGWPYATDPLAVPPRRHRLRQRVVPSRPPTEEEVEPRAQGVLSWD